MADGFFDVSIKGAEDVDNLVRAIRTHADAKALRKELYSGINRVSKRIREAMKASSADPANLPSRDGLQALIVKHQSVTTSAVAGKWAGVRIKVQGRSGGPDVGSIMRTGRVLHPTFGRGRFVSQSEGIKPRWMDETFEHQKDEVQKAILQVMEDVARKVTGGS